MAGSLNHIIGPDGKFSVNTLGHMGDAVGALEECFHIILYLSGGDMSKVSEACNALNYPDPYSDDDDGDNDGAHCAMCSDEDIPKLVMPKLRTCSDCARYQLGFCHANPPTLYIEPDQWDTDGIKTNFRMEHTLRPNAGHDDPACTGFAPVGVGVADMREVRP